MRGAARIAPRRITASPPQPTVRRHAGRDKERRKSAEWPPGARSFARCHAGRDKGRRTPAQWPPDAGSFARCPAGRDKVRRRMRGSNQRLGPALRRGPCGSIQRSVCLNAITCAAITARTMVALDRNDRDLVARRRRFGVEGVSAWASRRLGWASRRLGPGVSPRSGVQASQPGRRAPSAERPGAVAGPVGRRRSARHGPLGVARAPSASRTPNRYEKPSGVPRGAMQ
jgi:hypothetical protein